MRIFIAIVLLWVLALPIFITVISLQQHKILVRKQIKRQLKQSITLDQCLKFTFTNEESKRILVWKHSKEFEFKGEMYDVISQTQKGDTIIFWVWWDHHETLLNKQLDNLLAKAMHDDTHNQNQNNQLIKYFKSLFLSVSDYCLIFKEKNEKLFILYLLKETIKFVGLMYQPPEVLSYEF